MKKQQIVDIPINVSLRAMISGKIYSSRDRHYLVGLDTDLNQICAIDLEATDLQVLTYQLEGPNGLQIQPVDILYYSEDTTIIIENSITLCTVESGSIVPSKKMDIGPYIVAAQFGGNNLMLSPGKWRHFASAETSYGKGWILREVDFKTWTIDTLAMVPRELGRYIDLSIDGRVSTNVTVPASIPYHEDLVYWMWFYDRILDLKGHPVLRFEGASNNLKNLLQFDNFYDLMDGRNRMDENLLLFYSPSLDKWISTHRQKFYGERDSKHLLKLHDAFGNELAEWDLTGKSLMIVPGNEIIALSTTSKEQLELLYYQVDLGD